MPETISSSIEQEAFAFSLTQQLSSLYDRFYLSMYGEIGGIVVHQIQSVFGIISRVSHEER